MDTTMCVNIGCKRRNKCLRFTAIPNPFWQAYSNFPEKDCKMFCKNKHYYNYKEKICICGNYFGVNEEGEKETWECSRCGRKLIFPHKYWREEC